MSVITKEQIENLKTRKSKLEFHMEQAVQERNALQEELDSLLPEVEQKFGTTDPIKLEEIAKDLQTQIEAQIQELAEMGITI